MRQFNVIRLDSGLISAIIGFWERDLKFILTLKPKEARDFPIQD